MVGGGSVGGGGRGRWVTEGGRKGQRWLGNQRKMINTGERETDRQTDRQTEGGRKGQRWLGNQRKMINSGERERQTDRQAGRQREGEKDKGGWETKEK